MMPDLLTDEQIAEGRKLHENSRGNPASLEAYCKWIHWRYENIFPALDTIEALRAELADARAQRDNGNQAIERLTDERETCISDLKAVESQRVKLINRRVEIEQVMLDAANGKRPMPDATTLKLWALALGTPKECWSKQVKEAMAHGR